MEVSCSPEMFGEPELPGRRLEIVRDEDGQPNLNRCLPVEEGDYVGPLRGYTGAAEAVFYILPGGDGKLHHVTSPPHEFVENEDGSLTIHPSILTAGWHGYLTQGRWKTV